MAQGGKPVIIKKVKKGGHGGHHGGAWKVAYADFVTAMMAFFLVMWIVGLSESTRRAIAGYFREPGVFEFMKTKGTPIQVKVLENTQREGDGSGLSGEDGSRRSDVVDIGPMKQCPKINVLKKGEAERLARLQAEIKKELARLASETQGKGKKGIKIKDARSILDSVQVQITAEGLRIELAETTDLAYFDSGGSEPNKVAVEVLTALAPKLKELGNNVVIEGHTDTVPYVRGSKKSNWELSVERANAARTLLLDAGLDEKQVASVTGYGDRRLRKPDAPTDVANRRVSIIVQGEQTLVTPEPVDPSTTPEPAPEPGPGIVPRLVPPIEPPTEKPGEHGAAGGHGAEPTKL
jgi:chemotaxis protein MotB